MMFSRITLELKNILYLAYNVFLYMITCAMDIYNDHVYGSCKLCCKPFNNGVEIAVYNCDHKYHKSCLIKQKLSIYPPLCSWCNLNTNRRGNKIMYKKNCVINLTYKKWGINIVIDVFNILLIYILVKILVAYFVVIYL